MKLSWANIDNFENETGIDIYDEGEDELAPYDLLVKNTKADELYFTFCDGWRSLGVCICPKAFFDANGFMWDLHISGCDAIPDYLEEAMECVFETPATMTQEQVEADMISKGFVYSKELQKLAESGGI